MQPLPVARSSNNRSLVFCSSLFSLSFLAATSAAPAWGLGPLYTPVGFPQLPITQRSLSVHSSYARQLFETDLYPFFTHSMCASLRSCPCHNQMPAIANAMVSAM